MNIQIVLALLLVAVLQLASGFEVKDCAAKKNPDAKLVSLHIDTCPDASGSYCDFTKGQNATMTLDVEPSK